jgi:hypothetical protein
MPPEIFLLFRHIFDVNTSLNFIFESQASLLGNTNDQIIRYRLFDTYGGNPYAHFRGDSHARTIDPVVIVAAMAMVSKLVSFAIKGSTTYLSK